MTLRCAWQYRAVSTAVLLASLGIGSCVDSTVASITVTSIDLAPTTISLRAGSTATLTARPVDTNHNPIDVRGITWSSNNNLVATVSSNGVVTALSPGDARIAASAMGKSAVATVSVTARVVASVVVTPATVSMRVGVSAPLQVQTLDVDGVVLTGRAVTWLSSNSAIATVNAQGIVTGIAAGATTVTATSEGRSGQVAVTVTLPPVQTITIIPSLDTLGVGTERNLSAVVRDASGATLTGRALAWSSNDITVASVSSTGVVNALAPGTTKIVVSSEGRIGSATIVVLARLAGTVTVTPSSTTLIVNGTQQLSAQITDSLGTLLTGRVLTFGSDAPSIATVTMSGVVTAIAPGLARVTATSEGKIGIASITVIAEPVVSVQLSPNTLNLLTGATQQLTAAALSANGTVLIGRSVTWTAGAPSIASVTSSGVVSALTPGVAIILAVIDGVSATSTVTVTRPSVASIALAPLAPSIAVSELVQLSATLRDATGASLIGRVITWSSADESVAFVSSSGLVVGFKGGIVRITATSEGVSASTLVTVR